MIDFIFNTLVYTLAIYGLIEIIRAIVYIMDYTNLNEDGIYIIIAVKNQENKIDNIIKSLIFKIMYGKEKEIKKVILTDLDSKDDTLPKIKNLKKDNEYINVTSWRQCKRIIDVIDDM